MSEEMTRAEVAQAAADVEAMQARSAQDDGGVGKTPEQKIMETLERMSAGRLTLLRPIEDGGVAYRELNYDFNALTGWEMARALDQPGGGNPNDINDQQALALFAAAAAKVTIGPDAKDIRERMGAMDAIAAINLAALFFKGSLLVANARITNT